MSQRLWIVCRGAVWTAIACAVLGTSATAAATAARVQVGRAPALPAGARTTGPLAASTRIQLSIALQPRDPSALQAFATAVSTPGSPQFRHYLSVAQFAERFGATNAAIAAVQSTLRSDGLTVRAPMANHLALQASGTAADVQRAFGTRLSSVKLAGGRNTYANTTAPVLPAAVAADVQGVVGLNDLVTEQHPEATAPVPALEPARRSLTANVATGGPQPCTSALNTVSSQGGYTADTIAAAYGFSSLYGAGDLGGGQTIALYELEPYNASDVSTYQTCYGTSTSITNVGVDSPPAFKSGDDDAEAALDIEQLIGLAPAAKIIVYDAPNTDAGAIDEFNTIVSQDQAKVVSSSWGICESALVSGDPTALQAENSDFEEAAAQGQSIYVASGDAGSAACSQSSSNDTALSVSDPAAQPFVTGVGGTTLYSTNASGRPILWAPGDTLDQSVWNDGTDTSTSPPQASASGGGISSEWAMPSYQSGAAKSVGVISGDSSGAPCHQTSSDCRQVPDVSANGDPDSGYVAFVDGGQSDGGWLVIGGTSAAAPLWAAFTGLVNADPSCRGHTVGFVNPALYQLAGSAYASNISDVTLASPVTGLGNNDALGVNGGLYPVTSGYDMTTGLGTPIAPNLAASLCALASPVFTVTVANPGAQSGTVGSAQSLQVHATDSGGVPVTYAATGLPEGLTINPASGLISGTPTSAGTSAVTVTATDSPGNTGSTQFSWTIAAPPTSTTTVPTTTTTTATTAPTTATTTPSAAAAKKTAGHPKITSASLTGVGHGRPKLKLTVAAGSNAPALKTISIALPSGLQLSTRRSRGVSATARFKARLQRGRLTLSLRSPVRRVTITIVGPSLGAKTALETKARHHKLGTLRLAVRTTDTSNTSLTATVKVKDTG